MLEASLPPSKSCVKFIRNALQGTQGKPPPPHWYWLWHLWLYDPTNNEHQQGKDSMRIPQEILDQTIDDPLAGAVAACSFIFEILQSGSEWDENDEELLLEGYALVSSQIAAGRIAVDVNPPLVNGTLAATCSQLHSFLTETHEQLDAKFRHQTNQRKIEQYRNHFSITLNNAFSYEFTDGDLKRIRALINELRELITENTELDEDHKLRLLKRLEKMQAEIHKKVSDLNAFYGLAVEASVMFKKVGENAKPIVDRIKELTGISWNTQARAENLPSGTEPPMLENDSTPTAIE
ncbi:hypothetical protein [Pseudomonas frederiksbergensis]|nr:hypothetical protein [Pseudomonas frederiksbergensis]